MIPSGIVGTFPQGGYTGDPEIIHDWAIEWGGQFQPVINGGVDLPNSFGTNVPNAVYWANANNDTTAHASDPAQALVSQPKASIIFGSLVDAMKALPVMPWDQGE